MSPDSPSHPFRAAKQRGMPGGTAIQHSVSAGPTPATIIDASSFGSKSTEHSIDSTHDLFGDGSLVRISASAFLSSPHDCRERIARPATSPTIIATESSTRKRSNQSPPSWAPLAGAYARATLSPGNSGSSSGMNARWIATACRSLIGPIGDHPVPVWLVTSRKATMTEPSNRVSLACGTIPRSERR